MATDFLNPRPGFPLAYLKRLRWWEAVVFLIAAWVGWITESIAWRCAVACGRIDGRRYLRESGNAWSENQ